MKYEKLPTVCPECHGKVVLGDTTARYGKAYGEERIFFCTNCNAYACAEYNKESELYEAVSHLRSRKTRKDQKEVLEMIEKKYKNKVPEEVYEKARAMVYIYIAKNLGLPLDDCMVNDMYYGDIIRAKLLLQKSWMDFEKDLVRLKTDYYKEHYSDAARRKLKLLNQSSYFKY